MKNWILVIFILLLASCATGSTIITGKRKPAIAYETVVIYLEDPKNYEVIGLVTAFSDMGFTEQQVSDYSIMEIKKQAAKIGANGVVILKTDFDYNTGKSISGKAIFVNK